MSTPDRSRDEDALAYVLGVGTADERDAVARKLADDPDLASLVADWNERLGPLADDLPEVQPGPGLLGRIEAAIDSAAGQASGASARELRHLRRSRNFWRGTCAGAAALAAALAIYIALPPRQAGGPRSVLVAAVNRSGELPALIVRVDATTGTVQVRSLATEAPADRSLELWSLGSGGSPRSLGLVTGPATTLMVGRHGTAVRDGETLAVSLEPKGGSPTGLPTGPVIYTGKLVAEDP